MRATWLSLKKDVYKRQGELLDIDAFNQPGVEESKIASYAVLGNQNEKYLKKAEMCIRDRRCPGPPGW